MNKENESLRANIARAEETKKKMSDKITTLSEQVRRLGVHVCWSNLDGATLVSQCR